TCSVWGGHRRGGSGHRCWRASRWVGALQRIRWPRRQTGSRNARHRPMKIRLFGVTALAATLLVAMDAAEIQIESGIPKPDDAPKPMSPEESARAFQLPEGFRIEVVASEPLLASPSAVCWDERGRMFVSELHGYNLEGQLDIEELNKTGKLDTQVRRVQAEEKFKQAAQGGTYGVIKWLVDTNGDGRMDKAVVWAA